MLQQKLKGFLENLYIDTNGIVFGHHCISYYIFNFMTYQSKLIKDQKSF